MASKGDNIESTNLQNKLQNTKKTLIKVFSLKIFLEHIDVKNRKIPNKSVKEEVSTERAGAQKDDVIKV